jgi:hypothetical protein
MNTLSDIEKRYQVKDGRIISPGMFKGEHAYLPIAYDTYMDGCADELANGTLRVWIDDDLRKEFPILEKKQSIRFYVRSDGFVCEV